MSLAARLKRTIESSIGASVEVEIGRHGDSSTVRVFPPSPAAQAVVDAFDWSDAAQQAWEEDQRPERKAIRQAAAAAVTDNQTYLAIATPTAVQVAAQVRRLTQQNIAIIRRIIQID